MTDILNADVQARLHAENQDAIKQLRERVDLLLAQSEKQSVALRLLVGANIDDLAALQRFRAEHDRLNRYDSLISTATGDVLKWMIRLAAAMAIVLLATLLSITGLGQHLKDLLGLH